MPCIKFKPTPYECLFLPEDTSSRAAWLCNFIVRRCLYAGKYAIGHEDMPDVQEGSMIFRYGLDCKNKYEAYLCKCRSYRGMQEGNSLLLTLLSPKGFRPPKAGSPDVFVPVAELVPRIRTRASFTDADGMDMGVGGMEMCGKIIQMWPYRLYTPDYYKDGLVQIVGNPGIVILSIHKYSYMVSQVTMLRLCIAFIGSADSRRHTCPENETQQTPDSYGMAGRMCF